MRPVSSICHKFWLCIVTRFLAKSSAMPAAGGTGSVGSLVALWLAEHATSHIILLGRSGRHPPESQLATYTCVHIQFVALVHGEQIRHPGLP